MPILSLHDIDLYYEIAGVGPPLLFIHGLGSSAKDWDKQAEFFSGRYQVIVFDVRGHGRSSKPAGPYSIPLFTMDTAGLIATLGIGPAHVVGLSMGGMIGFELANDHPEKVSSLTIVNSAPYLPVHSVRVWILVKLRLLTVRLFGMRKMGEILSKKLFPKEEHQQIRTMFIEKWAQNDARAYNDALRAIAGWRGIARLEKILCPTLVMASDQDYTPVAVKEAYIERMPRAELVVLEDARHAVPIEKPDVFNKTLEAFLARRG